MASFTIVKGPSKFDLMLALFDRNPNAHELGKPRMVSFALGDLHETPVSPLTPTKHLVVINSVQVEDGSGESWNIEGENRDRGEHFTAYYSTKTRTGVLKTLDKK